MKHEIRIFTAMDSIQADMIVNVLEDNQIPAFKKEIGAGEIMHLYGGNSKFGTEIYISETNADSAREILQGMGLFV